MRINLDKDTHGKEISLYAGEEEKAYIRERRMDKMQKIYKAFIMFVIAIGIFQVTGCSSKSMEKKAVEEKNNTVELSRANKKDKKLVASIPQFDSIPAKGDNCMVSVVGAELIKSTGDVVKDATIVGNGIKGTSDDAIQKGYDMGFMETSDKEVSKRDAYLCLYIKYGFEKEDVSQRDSVIPKYDIEVSDDKDDVLVLIHNSMKENYIDMDCPYGIVILKGYYDAKTYKIHIGDTVYLLDTELLRKKHKN